jgi:predicted molibdopterin-dependent oxidoreductase YjgC
MPQTALLGDRNAVRLRRALSLRRDRFLSVRSSSRKFIEEHCAGLEEFKAHVATLDHDSLRAIGLTMEEIDKLAARYIKADTVIITWAMTLTQYKDTVAIIKEITILLLLRGNSQCVRRNVGGNVAMSLPL